MVSLTTDQIHSVLQDPTLIRNIIVTGSVDQGSSTLRDALLAAAGFPVHHREVQLWDRKVDEVTPRQHQNMSMALHVKVPSHDGDPEKRDDLIVNLIMTSSANNHGYAGTVSRSQSRVADGAIVVVDVVEGLVTMSDETVLRHLVSERIRPVLFANKLDRCFTELQLTPEQTYQSLSRVVDNFNAVMMSFHDPAMGNLIVSPCDGQVAFGSALHSWAFNVEAFAKKYANKFGVSVSTMKSRLWGDHFYDPALKKWFTTPTGDGGVLRKRAFCQFCLEPIQQLVDAVMNDRQDRLTKMLSVIDVTVTPDERNQTPRRLWATIMSRFLPIGDAILTGMAATQLPSPKEAQAYRAELLYTGVASTSSDPHFAGVKNCDPQAPLMMYVSRLSPTVDKGRFMAFGRVFSGTIRTGMKCRIMADNHVPGQTKNVFDQRPIQRVVMLVGRSFMEAVESMPCGNVVALVGVDRYMLQSGTITDAGAVDAFPFRGLPCSTSPVVQVMIEPMNPNDLAKFVEGMKRLARQDPMAQCTIEETGLHRLAGTCHSHVEACVATLQNDLMYGHAMKISEPFVSIRETVSTSSAVQCMTVSANKHNRLFCRASPLSEELSVAIDHTPTVAFVDSDRSQTLINDFGWDRDAVARIWAYGPDNGVGPNIVANMTKGVANVRELSDSIVAAWQWATKEGALAEEPMRGVRVDVEHATLHADSIHRGGGQIIPAMRRAAYACQLTAQPRFFEPVFMVEIESPETALAQVYNVLLRRQAVVVEECNRLGTDLYRLRVQIPVSCCVGLEAELRAETGRYDVTVDLPVFDHWQLVPGDPLAAVHQDDGDNDGATTPATAAQVLMASIRERKGLPPGLPTAASFMEQPPS